MKKEYKSLRRQEALLPPKKKVKTQAVNGFKKRGCKKRENYVIEMIKTMRTEWKKSKAMVVKTKAQKEERKKLNNKISAQESRTVGKLKKLRKSIQSRQKDQRWNKLVERLAPVLERTSRAEVRKVLLEEGSEELKAKSETMGIGQLMKELIGTD